MEYMDKSSTVPYACAVEVKGHIISPGEMKALAVSEEGLCWQMGWIDCNDAIGTHKVTQECCR